MRTGSKDHGGETELINSTVIKAAEELWQEELFKTRAKMEEQIWEAGLTGGLQGIRVTLSVMRRAI